MAGYWEVCMSWGFCFIYDVDQYHITENSSKRQCLLYHEREKKRGCFLHQELKIWLQVWSKLSGADVLRSGKKIASTCLQLDWVLGSTSCQDVVQATKISLIYLAAGRNWGIHLAQITWYSLCNINTANVLQDGTKLDSSSGHWWLLWSLNDAEISCSFHNTSLVAFCDSICLFGGFRRFSEACVIPKGQLSELKSPCGYDKQCCCSSGTLNTQHLNVVQSMR